MMNAKLKALLDSYEIPTVPYLGNYENVYEMVMKNYDWMINGNGEGIVAVIGGT